MATFREKQLKNMIDKIFGNSPQAQEMKDIVFKANTEGFTQEEIEQYKQKKLEDIQLINDFFKEDTIEEEIVQPKTIYGRIISNEILDDKPEATECATNTIE
jgi:hypothetical protein